MADTTNQSQAVATQQPANKVALTVDLINKQPNAKAILEMPAIQDAWVQTYAKVSGKGIEDAALRFEAEKILFLKTISENNSLANADKFSIYTSFIELSISGGTLRDGLCYIVPFKGKAAFLPGWKFRLEQINELPEVVYCHEPVVVYNCDEFDYEMGMQPRIIKHKPGIRTAESRPTHVYFVIDFKHGKTGVYVMDAVKVLQIRDTYSQSYKEYLKKKASGKWEDWMELPMWVKDESQAFQKTIVKQTWKHLPKLPKHKWLDERLKAQGAEDIDADEVKGDQNIDFNNLILKNENEGTGNTQNDAGGEGNSNTQQQTNAGSNDVGQQQGNASHISEAEIVSETKNADTANGQAAGIPGDLKELASNPNDGF